jgi:RHS repeat-associated protein
MMNAAIRPRFSVASRRPSRVATCREASDDIVDIVDTADFNGDGKADILIRHTDATEAILIMNGSAVTSATYLLRAGSTARSTHTGDFNGDGKADIILTYTDGTALTLLMNGATVTTNGLLLLAGSGWQVVRTGDLNADGKTDIIAQHSDGSIVTLLMNGLTPTANVIAQGDASLQVRGIGDTNADNKRDLIVRRSVPALTRYVYDASGRLAGEYDGAGRLMQETVWLGDLPVATLRPKANGVSGVEVFYVGVDHLGTPRVVTRPTDNKVVWSWENSEAFGNSLVNENPSGLGAFTYNLRMPGQQFDRETGTFYNYFRDYDSSLGRYVQSDPIGLLGGMSTFGYARGNPISRTDPFGLFNFPLPFGQAGGGGGIHVGPLGFNFNCGVIFSLGGQACSYCTVCARLGPGLYAGAGMSLGGGIVGGDANNLSGSSVGLGGDVGSGPSAGGSASVGLSGNPITGSAGRIASAGALRGRFGPGFGASIGFEYCKTELKCTDYCLN